jgi:hypothetical protein
MQCRDHDSILLVAWVTAVSLPWWRAGQVGCCVAFGLFFVVFLVVGRLGVCWSWVNAFSPDPSVISRRICTVVYSRTNFWIPERSCRIITESYPMGFLPIIL